MRKNLKIFAVILIMLFTLAPDIQAHAAGEYGTQYRILVNRAANCVTVYERGTDGEPDFPVKAFLCSVGRQGHETPLGTYRTSDYYPWCRMVDNSYGRYAIRINKGIMFHSIPYYAMNRGRMEWEQFNLLGEPASLGCIRLAYADIKWIYDNCKAGTEVVIYDDAENPGPLGKPLELKTAEGNPIKDWDPTDMEDGNPWNAYRPQLYLKDFPEDGVLRLPLGASQTDIYNAVGLIDYTGEVLEMHEYLIVLSGKYDLNCKGIYNVSVRGIAPSGIRAEQSMILLVE